MDNLEFENLHQHSCYSINDCISKIPQIVEKAIELGQKSVAITDHGTLGGTYDLWKECNNKKVKAILGVEGYYVDSYIEPGMDIPYNYSHIILLAKTNEGWDNLKKIQLNAWQDGYLKKPRIDLDSLKKYSKGLVCTSACLKGLVGWNYIATNDKFNEEATTKQRKKTVRDRVQKFLDIFGDDFYFEIHFNEIRNQMILNKYIMRLARKMNIKVIAANDCHYINKGDDKYHDIMICHSRKKTLENGTEEVYSRWTKGLFMKSAKGMYNSWKKRHSDYITEEECLKSFKNTIEIRDKIEPFSIKHKMTCLPKFCDNPKELMYNWVMKGYVKKLTKEQQESKEYKDRIEYEFGVFEKLGMESYMLVCTDIINMAKAKDIPCGPGRGSVCGSLVAYCLDITQIDPIRFNIMFERFLISSRLSLPDIDMDFGRDGREKIKQMVMEKYGDDKFASIVNYGEWKPRGLIKDIGKVLGKSYNEMDKITKKIHDKTSKFEDEEYPIPDEVVQWLNENSDIREPAMILEGVFRQRGVHASGMLLTPTPLEDWMPIAFMVDKDSEDKKKIKVSEWDMYAAEDLNLLKIDFLGLQTLDVIKTCCDHIAKRNNNKFHIDQLWNLCLDNLEDKIVYQDIADGKIMGCFQIETSDGMAELIKKMQPNCFNDIVLLISLYRTAVIKAGMLDEYINRRNGEDFDYIHPKLEPILKKTLGILVFQEDLMRIAVDVGGFTPQESDNFRKATKLKDPEKFKPWKEQFVNGCIKNRLSDSTADELWGWIYQFSGYGFNISHASAYALMTYATAYLKHYYPTEYMAAVMSWNSDDDFMMPKYLKECKSLGIKLRNPEINKSRKQFRIMNKRLVYPFKSIKGVGSKVVDAILKERINGKYKSFDDFYERVNKRVVNIRVLVNLILCGAFRKIENKDIGVVFDQLIRERKEKNCYRQVYCKSCELRYPCSVKSNEAKDFCCPSCGSGSVDFNKDLCSGKSFSYSYINSQVYGYNVGGNQLTKYVNMISKHKVEPLSSIEELEEGDKFNTAIIVKRIKSHVDKNGNEMAFLDISDNEYSSSIVIFANEWLEFKSKIKLNCCYILKNVLKNRGNILFSGRGKIISKLIRLGL